MTGIFATGRARVEARKGGGLAGAVEPDGSAVERPKDRNGFLPKTGKGVEQVTLGLEVGGVVDSLPNGGPDLGDDAFQRRAR